MDTKKKRASSRPPAAKESPPSEPAKARSSRAPKAETKTNGEHRDDVMTMTDEERHRRIAEAAYFRAEKREFTPGAELEDWLVAEQSLER